MHFAEKAPEAASAATKKWENAEEIKKAKASTTEEAQTHAELLQQKFQAQQAKVEKAAAELEEAEISEEKPRQSWREQREAAGRLAQASNMAAHTLACAVSAEEAAQKVAKEKQTEAENATNLAQAENAAPAAEAEATIRKKIAEEAQDESYCGPVSCQTRRAYLCPGQHATPIR